MSVTAAMARVAEIDALVSRASGARPAAAGAGFEQQLAAAQGAPAAQAAAGTAGTGTNGTGTNGTGTNGPFGGEIAAAAARHGLDPALLRGLIRAESGFNPSAGSPAGAQGLTQLMPATARSLGVTNPFDPVQSIEGGARYLRQQLDRFGGDERLALAAYNAGPGAVQRFGGVPPYAETQKYVQKVLGFAAEYRAAAPAAAALPATSAMAPAAAAGQAGSVSLPYSVI